MTIQAIQVHESITVKCERAIQFIMAAMRKMAVTTIGSSYGKESSCVLALSLEAARRLKAEGIDHPVIVLTADTGVENPAMITLAHRMSVTMLDFAAEEGLNVEQRWVKPNPLDNYLVAMIGGRSTASVPGGSSSCTVDLKITPMQREKRKLAKEYGAENILTLIGTRFAESNTRGSAMRQRGESASTPRFQEDGSALLSPIADWALGDVWALLNGSEQQLGFRTLDFTRTLALYETVGGESTCSIGAIDPTFQKQASGGCGTAGRTGCWACQRVTRDNSLEAMLDTKPAYEPLVRLSRTIRAGHYLPENRSYLGRSIKDGQIKVFANGYSPQWTEALLTYALSVDANEDDYARRTGKDRRFPKILPEEHLMLIAFQWARYGLHHPGAFIRIYSDIVVGGVRVALPTDAELEAMNRRGDTSLVGKDLGTLQIGHTETKPAFRDSWRAMVDQDAPCRAPVMDQPTGYTASNGTRHDSLMYAEGIQANLDALRDEAGNLGIAFHDFMWWWEMSFASGGRSNAEELAWLLREGVIEARRGYQAKIAEYQRYSQCVAEMDLENATLDDVIHHPTFTRAPSASTRVGAENALQADLFDWEAKANWPQTGRAKARVSPITEARRPGRRAKPDPDRQGRCVIAHLRPTD